MCNSKYNRKPGERISALRGIFIKQAKPPPDIYLSDFNESPVRSLFLSFFVSVRMKF